MKIADRQLGWVGTPGLQFFHNFLGHLEEFRRTFSDIVIDTAGKSEENLSYFGIFK